MKVYLSLYTYNSRPNQLDINDFTINRKVNNLKHKANTIIKSNSFPLLTNLAIKEKHLKLTKAMSVLKMKQYEFKKDLIDKRDLSALEQWIRFEKRDFEDEIENLSTITPQKLLDDINHGNPIDNDIKKHIHETFGENIEPVVDMDIENEIFDMKYNPIVVDAFEKATDISFDILSKIPVSTPFSNIYILTPDDLGKFKNFLERDINLARRTQHVRSKFTNGKGIDETVEDAQIILNTFKTSTENDKYYILNTF